MTPLLLLALACGGPSPSTLADAPPVWLEARHVDEGQPVRVHVPAGTTLPAVEGITATQVVTGDDGSATWELRGAAGSYVLEVPSASGEPTRLFFDIGVEGPTGGPMQDIASLPPPTPPLWPRVAAAVAAVGFVVAAAALAWRKLKPAPPPPPPEPPDRIARRAWAALRLRDDLPPDVLAAELSAVYRRYLEAVHRWPATSRTSREILDALAGDLPAVQLDRARRLLNAMDIVRFSDRSTHEGFFSALDADFEALLAAPVRSARA